MHLFWKGVLSVGLGGLAFCNAARADVMTQWTFESYTAPTTATAVLPNVTPDFGSGILTGTHATAVTFTTPTGNGSTKSLSAPNWVAGDYWQFGIPAGYAGLQVEFDQTSSGTGPLAFHIDYSTDGTSFTQFANYALSSSVSFASATPKTDSPPRFLFDFSGISAVTNPANPVTFRLVATSAGSSTAGTDRIDNVTVGTNLPAPTPEPASVSLFLTAGAGLLAARRRR